MLGYNLAGTSHIWSPCQFAGNANSGGSTRDQTFVTPGWQTNTIYNMLANSS